MDPTRFDHLVRAAATERGAATATGNDSPAHSGTLSRGSALKALGAALIGGLLGITAPPEDAEAKRRKRRKRKRRKPTPVPSVPTPVPAQATPKLLWATVERDGRLLRGSGAVSSKRTSDGSYRVYFNRDVEECAHVAQIQFFSALGEVYTHRSPAEPTSVIVLTYDTSQGPRAANKEFHLMVMC